MRGHQHRRPDRLDHLIADLPGVSLAQLNEGAALMTRTDQKYFVPRDILAGLMEEFRGVAILDIDGIRRHEYSSTYYDTPNLLFLRQHVQGRRTRHKVRTRTYASGLSFLEVKAKSGRGETVKERITWSGQDLDATARGFLDPHLASPGLSLRLRPMLHSSYRRVTLLQGQNRITCDFDLAFAAPGGRVIHGGNTDVLVETKTATGRGAVDRYLHTRGIRPVSVSKYGVGVALAYPRVPANRWHRVLREHFGQVRTEPALNVHSLLSRNVTGVTAAIVRS